MGRIDITVPITLWVPICFINFIGVSLNTSYPESQPDQLIYENLLSDAKLVFYTFFFPFSTN